MIYRPGTAWEGRAVKSASPLMADELVACVATGVPATPAQVSRLAARIWAEADLLPKLGTEKIDKVGLRAKYRKVYESELVAA